MTTIRHMTIRQRKLTDFEVQILTLIAQGYSGPEAAAEMGIRETSIVSALAKIRRKLDARTTTHAVVIAIKQRLL